MNPRHALQQLLQPNIIVGASVVVAVIIVAIGALTIGKQPTGTYILPTRGPLVEEVSAPGTVQAADSIDLSFQTAGRIASLSAPVGSKVYPGKVLAALSSADLEASLEQARAALQVQQANLDALMAGTRPQDVAVSQTTVAGAQTALSQTAITLAQAAQNAYVAADDAVHNKVDQVLSNPRSVNPTLLVPLPDSQLLSEIQGGRVAMEGLLQTWQGFSASVAANPQTVDPGVVASTTRDYLMQTGAFLDLIATGLTKVVTTTTYPTASIQAFQTSIASARTAISTALAAINSADTAQKAAAAQLSSAQSQLTLKQAGATPEAIRAQQAQVAVAQANVDAANAQIGKTVIVAPITGIITVDNAHVGQTFAPGVPVISMNSSARFQIIEYVSQADLGKIAVGKAAQVVLDAYQGSDEIPAHVIAIDPAATINNGISSYKVTLEFDTDDAREQAGLTATVRITAQSVADALSVPTSAIITRGNDHVVLRKMAQGDVETPVTIGVSTASGLTQILSGINDTDQIRTFGTQH